MPWLLSLSDWLIHAALVSLPIFAAGGVAVLCCRQPVRRVRLIELTLAACLAAPWLGLVPGWPQWSVPWPARDVAVESREAPPVEFLAEEESTPARWHGDLSAVMMDERPEPDAAEEAVAFGTSAEPFEAAPNEPAPDGTRAAWQVPAAWLDVRLWIDVVWLLGAGGLGVWWLMGIVGLARLVRRARPVPEACRAALREIAGPAAERVALLQSDRIDQPFACLGLRLRPIIVLPASLCVSPCSGGSHDGQALRWCLAHEWSHIEHRDLWAWLLAGLVRTLFFYQPLAWRLRRELRLCQDYIADARAAEQTGDPEDYTQFLTAQAITGPRRIAAAGLGIGGGKSDLYRRVVMVVRNAGSLEGRCGRFWNLFAVAAMLMVLVGVSSFRSPLAAVETTAVEAKSLQKPTTATIEDDGIGQRSVGVSSAATETPKDAEQAQDKAQDAPAEVSRMRLTTVRASDDMPLPDLRIDVEFWRDGKHQESFVTNRSGVADLELPPGSQNLLWVRIRAHPSGMVPISLAWGASSAARLFSPPGELTVRFESGATIGGIVKDELGAPLEGATVEIHRDARDVGSDIKLTTAHQTASDENGRWSWDVAPADLEDLMLNVTHPDYANKPVFRRLVSIAALDAFRRRTAVSTLVAGYEVTGRVTDADGKPIADARAAVGENRLGSYIRSASTDRDGRFAIKYSADGPSIVTIEAAGHRPELREVIVSAEMEPLDFALKPPAIIRGRVVDPEGNPVSEAFAAADTWRGHRTLSWRVDTDDQGRFEWKSAPHGAVLFDFGRHGYFYNRGVRLIPQDEEHVVILRPAQPGDDLERPPEQNAGAMRPARAPANMVIVAGTCRDDEGRPIIGGEVRLVQTDGRTSSQRVLQTVRTDRLGRFSFGAVPEITEEDRRPRNGSGNWLN